MKILLILFDSVLQLAIAIYVMTVVKAIGQYYDIAIVEEMRPDELIGLVIIFNIVLRRRSSYSRFRKLLKEPIEDPINESDFMGIFLYRLLEMLNISYLSLLAILLSFLI